MIIVYECVCFTEWYMRWSCLFHIISVPQRNCWTLPQTGYEGLLYRSIVELNSRLPFHCPRSIVELKLWDTYSGLFWFLPNTCYEVAAFKLWLLKIFWKINLGQAGGIHKRNLDCWMLRILPSYSFCYSALSSRSHWLYCKVKPKKNRGAGQMLFR